MAIDKYQVSKRGQMALPADARRRWGIADGGTVDVVDLGDALLIAPTATGGLSSMVSSAVEQAGGYALLSKAAAADDPDLA